MSTAKVPPAVLADHVPLRTTPSIYPAAFAVRVAGRDKRQLGDYFGLKNYGVNLTRLAPGAQSALRHAHSKQDEFIYVLEGSPTLVTDEGRMALAPGMCAGFPGGSGNAHHLINETSNDAIYLEVGDRTPGEDVSYPDDDLQIVTIDGRRRFARKDGTPY